MSEQIQNIKTRVLQYLGSEIPIRPCSIGPRRLFPVASIEIDFGKWYTPLIVAMVPLVGPFIIFLYGLNIGSLNVLIFAIAGLVWGKARMLFSLWIGTIIALVIVLVWKARAGKNTMRRFSVPMLVLQVVLSVIAYYVGPAWLGG